MNINKIKKINKINFISSSTYVLETIDCRAVSLIKVITNIAESLPNGYNLYVKEHPNMVVREWRSISAYKQIMSLPNVTLIHPTVKSQDIIKKSSLVISIFGTKCGSNPVSCSKINLERSQ